MGNERETIDDGLVERNAKIEKNRKKSIRAKIRNSQCRRHVCALHIFLLFIFDFDVRRLRFEGA